MIASSTTWAVVYTV